MRQRLLLNLLCFFFGTRFCTVCFVTAATTAAGGGGGALQFDGKNDIAQIISTTSLCSKEETASRFEFEEFTIEFWYHKRTSAGQQHIFGLNSGEGVQLVQWTGGVLKFRIDKTQQGSNTVVGRCRDSNYTPQKGHNWAVSVWCYLYVSIGIIVILLLDPTLMYTQHMAFVYRIEPGEVLYSKIVYVDGQMATEKKNKETALECKYSVAGTGNQEQYSVGGRLAVADVDIVEGAHKFEIDEFRIWTTGLTTDQIHARMYHVLTPEEIKNPDLLLYWDFDESGSLAIDRTGNGFDLRLGFSGYYEDGDYLVDRMPKRIPSKAPFVGSSQRYSKS